MFNIGDKVVYPMHGAGIIESIEEREILGDKRKYYILRLPLRNMKVMIPLNNVNSMGLRDIISDKEVEQVIAVLNDDESKMPQNWNRRYRANLDKIKSGDIYEVAGVVRNLMLREREKGLSTGERKMLNNAKQILISELVLVNDDEEDHVEELINESIR